MVKSLEQYVSEATQSYQPAKTALQNQLDALNGQLETTNQQINKNYAQQQAGLNRQRNMAAENASMQAAGSGGSFGGAANLANRKYYAQSFVPAQTQLQTNQANDLAQARQNSENQRLNLNSQMANLETQANQAALQQYWAAQEAEKTRAAQAASNNSAYQRIMDALGSKGYTLDSNKNMYGGYDWLDAQGNKHRAATVAAAAGGDFNEALWKILQTAAGDGYGDYYSQQVLNEINNGARFARNTGGGTGNSMYDTLGIKRIN